jgi:hypothetical protein
VAGGVDDAEQVPFGVREDDEVLTGLRCPRVAGRTDPEQTLHLARLVVRVEVEVQPVLPTRGFGTF